MLDATASAAGPKLDLHLLIKTVLREPGMKSDL